MNYWFLFKKDTGEIYGVPYLGSTEQWTNIPDGCGVIGPIPQSDVTATEAFTHSNYYTVKSGKLTTVSNIADLRAVDAAPKPPYVDPRDQQIQALQNDNQTMQETINYLLGL